MNCSLFNVQESCCVKDLFIYNNKKKVLGDSLKRKREVHHYQYYVMSIFDHTLSLPIVLSMRALLRLWATLFPSLPTNMRYMPTSLKLLNLHFTSSIIYPIQEQRPCSIDIGALKVAKKFPPNSKITFLMSISSTNVSAVGQDSNKNV